MGKKENASWLPFKILGTLCEMNSNYILYAENNNNIYKQQWNFQRGSIRKKELNEFL